MATQVVVSAWGWQPHIIKTELSRNPGGREDMTRKWSEAPYKKKQKKEEEEEEEEEKKKKKKKKKKTEM